MGATSWRYYTPHRDDPEVALQELRKQVYARGEYVDVTGPLEDVLGGIARRLGQDPGAPETRAIVEDSLRIQRAMDTGSTQGLSRSERALVERLRAFGALAASLGAPPPANRGRGLRSIDELLEAAAECGTHSILDIEHVAARLSFGVAAPLSQTSIRRVFGTAEPTHEQVEEHWAEIAEHLGQGRARYLSVYRAGGPHEIAFIGCSGD